MRADLGSFFFRYRNTIGPVLIVIAVAFGVPAYPLGRADLNLVLDVAGIGVALLGQALRVVTIGYDYIDRGGKDRRVYASKLIQGGMFAHCRNPLYTGNILLAVGIAMIVHSPVLYLTALPLVLLVYSCIVAAEERLLRRQFGDEYAQYCRRVHRWLPRWTGWTHSTAHMRFNWRRVLVKEYNTLFLVALALVAVKIWSDYEVQGSAALPAPAALWAAFLLWLGLYVLVRVLKKSGVIQP
jgi:protein-S-isoprenylcysteine O-methyltransferase Ste14